MPEKLCAPPSPLSETSKSNSGNCPEPRLWNFPPSFASSLPGLSPPDVSILRSRSKVPLRMLVGLLKVSSRTCWGSSSLPPPQAASSSAVASASAATLIRQKLI